MTQASYTFAQVHDMIRNGEIVISHEPSDWFQISGDLNLTGEGGMIAQYISGCFLVKDLTSYKDLGDHYMTEDQVYVSDMTMDLSDLVDRFDEYCHYIGVSLSDTVGDLDDTIWRMVEGLASYGLGCDSSGAEDCETYEGIQWYRSGLFRSTQEA